jgi:putative addiction module killer protein
MIETREWLDAKGRSPFREWFLRLPAPAAAKVRGALERIRLGNFGDHKSVGDGVWERRIDWGPGLRVCYARRGEEIVVLLGGGDKSSQQRDILRARERWRWEQ